MRKVSLWLGSSNLIFVWALFIYFISSLNSSWLPMNIIRILPIYLFQAKICFLILVGYDSCTIFSDLAMKRLAKLGTTVGHIFVPRSCNNSSELYSNSIETRVHTGGTTTKRGGQFWSKVTHLWRRRRRKFWEI